MKKYLKGFASLILATSILSTSFLNVSAKSVYISGNGSYSNYVTCTLRNKRQNAEIWVQCYNTVASANDIKMTTTSGRHIWSQRRAISFSGCRRFDLGCDHSAYRIYLKTYVNNRTRYGGTANIWGNNVTIK